MAERAHTLREALMAAEQLVHRLRRVLNDVAEDPDLGRPLGIRESIMRTVRDQPGAYTSSELADRLKDSVVSRSGDPRRVITVTIYALLRERQLVRDAEGRLSLCLEEVTVLA